MQLFFEFIDPVSGILEGRAVGRVWHTGASDASAGSRKMGSCTSSGRTAKEDSSSRGSGDEIRRKRAYSYHL
jgi:hypothetical protein